MKRGASCADSVAAYSHNSLEYFSINRIGTAQASTRGRQKDHDQGEPPALDEHAVMDAVLVPDAPDLPVAIIDVRDLAAWLVRCIEHGVVGTFNAMGSAQSFAEHLAAARQAARSAAEPVRAPEQWLREREVSEWDGTHSLPLWLMDRSGYGFNARSNARAVASGLSLRPLEETLRDGLAWREAEPCTDHKAGLTDADERSLLSDLAPRA